MVVTTTTSADRRNRSGDDDGSVCGHPTIRRRRPIPSHPSDA
ncbi:hypothetical protein [Nonomuraea endophytica]